ncbi:thiol:disulfide interchange protein DsbD [Paracandidimonas soli]|uniref:Thiol:disulfide interchange protein DsbD n=2 Tax=Paracandidimonas soli TaxID=1917182 RepID=A0A4V2VSK1_9BURK|nr:thiol:disulfide interchange protein DsbD [Paracandidimonas soli]
MQVFPSMRMNQVAATARAILWWPLALLLALALAMAPQAHAQEDFLEPEQAFRIAAAMATPTELVVQFTVAPDYYMYREQFRFELSPDASLLGEPQYPAGIVKYDPTFDKELEVYLRQVRIRLPLRAGAEAPQTLTVTSQGCADAGLCYAPMESELQLLPTASGYDVTGQGAGPLSVLERQDAASGAGVGGLLELGDMGFADYLASAGVWNIVLICLLLGLLLSFTPCVLPMVPILLTVIAGSAQGKAVPRSRGLSLSLAYVLGMSLVYTLLGVAAGLLGASLAAWLQTPWVLVLFALLLALLALAMFDVFTFQAPTALQSRMNTWLARVPGGRHGGAFLMGMVSALIVGPCVAAPLAGVLLFISQSGDVVLGGLALFALAWGQGVLLLVVGASSGALLPRAGAWMERVKHVFGLLLLATAWWMLMPVLPAGVLTFGWALLALWGAQLFGAFRVAAADAGPWGLLGKAVAWMLAIWGAAIVFGLAAGNTDPLRPLGGLGIAGGQAGIADAGPVRGAAAPLGAVTHPPFVRVSSEAELEAQLAQTTRPVMLDFYADWCVSCIEMERFTFSDPAVAQLMSQFLLLQVDVTANTQEDRALLKRFKLFGPPGIMFFDADGRLLANERVIGFQNAERFGRVLDKVLTARAPLSFLQ